MKNLFFLLPFIFLFSSCKHEVVFSEKTVNNRYTVSIPDYLVPCTDLHQTASLQYQDTIKDVYAIVIDEKKKTMENYDLNYDIDAYFNNIVKQPFLEFIKNGKVSPAGRQEINGNKALVAEITGKINNTDVYYRLGIIETPYTFYQVLVWTKAENKQEFMPDMIKIVESFKELPLPNEEIPKPKTLSDSVKITLKY